MPENLIEHSSLFVAFLIVSGLRPRGAKQIGALAVLVCVLAVIGQVAVYQVLFLLMYGFMQHQRVYRTTSAWNMLTLPKVFTMLFAAGVIASGILYFSIGNDKPATALVLLFSGIMICVTAGMWASVGWLNLRKRQEAAQ